VNILLTGSNGFLGSALLKTLQKTNNVFKLNRSNSDYNFNLESDQILFNEYFDLVIHAAGKAHSIPKSDQEKILFYESNVNGTQNLLNALIKVGKPKMFIFVSSVSVYGLIEGNSIIENSPLLAIDPYGQSKIHCEKIIQDWCNINNVICTILRLPLVVGSSPPGNLGNMIRGIKKGYYFNISGGLSKKSMVLASDVAKFILDAAYVGGIYNLTDGYHPNFNELSHCIAMQMDRKYVLNMSKFSAKVLAFFGDRLGNNFPINSNKFAKITSTLTFDDSKARKAFGWNPTPVLKGFKINE
jgi:nucleoside-diphosphate-sugar epimerase